MAPYAPAAARSQVQHAALTLLLMLLSHLVLMASPLHGMALSVGAGAQHRQHDPLRRADADQSERGGAQHGQHNAGALPSHQRPGRGTGLVAQRDLSDDCAIVAALPAGNPLKLMRAGAFGQAPSLAPRDVEPAFGRPARPAPRGAADPQALFQVFLL
jgi:hypothetical protein